MDKLSYKDGYLKGVSLTLNTLLKDCVISSMQWKDYKDKLFNDEIVVPENYLFYDRNYINELKQIKSKTNYMHKIIPLIKEIEKEGYINYKFKNMHDMLVNGVGINKSSASDILLVSDYFYNHDGSIKPEWKGFGTKSLLFLARRQKEGNKNIFKLRKSNIIKPTMSFTEIKDLFIPSSEL